MTDPRQRSKNVRTGLILLSIVAAFFVGIVVKQAMFG
jgi:hypothetical protein